MTIPKALKKWDLLFFILLFGIAYLYSYHYIFFLRPYSLHQWRQCDCLSITLNYYREGMHFFSPAVHTCGPSGNGMTSTSECPLIYYSVAILWKIFGYHEFIYRMLDTFLAFSGLYALYLLVKELTGSALWALLVSLLLFTSPIFAIYANNFLMDVPALSLALIAWYYFARYYKTKQNLYFYISMAFFMLAGLTKISGLISFVPLILFYVYELITYNKKSDNKLFTALLKQGVAIAISALGILAWVLYSIHYNNIHNSGIFSTEILPLWQLSIPEIHDILNKLFNNLLPQYFSMPIVYLTLILFAALLLNYKKISRFYFWFLLIIFIGMFLYILLWYSVFDVHDYYLINLLIFVPATMIAFIIFLKENYVEIFNSQKLKLLAGFFVILNIYYCAVQTKIRYPDTNPTVRNSFIVDETTRNFWNWYHYSYGTDMKAFETITPYLRSLGISRTDKVISMPDQSINITLYLMDQKGYDDFAWGGLKNELRIKEFIYQGAKYLILSNKSYLDFDWLKPYLKNKIGAYQNVSIYDLRNIK